jgi:hypothetical protein
MARLSPMLTLSLRNSSASWRVCSMWRHPGETSRKANARGIQRSHRGEDVKEGMTYHMVLMSFGNPDEKKVNDSSSSLIKSWYYLKEGHRWVVDFTDGKVSKVRVY